jgi:glutathione S-transferase
MVGRSSARAGGERQGHGMFRIYGSGPSRSRRVLWACEEAGASYEVVEMAWPPSTTTPEFLKVNPAGTVPVLEDGPVRLIESMAICEYVGRKQGADMVLEPTDPSYYEYLELAQFGEATLGAAGVWARRFGPISSEVLADGRESFARRIAVIEQVLANGREFLTAGRFTLADLSVGWAVTRAEAWGVGDLVPPATLAYGDRMRARPAFRRAHGLEPAAV